MTSVTSADNIISNVPDFFGHAKVCQGTYMSGILTHLRLEMGADFDDYTFIIFENEHGDPDYLNNRLFTPKKEVVFFLGDEAATMPHELMKSEVHAVFKHYLPSQTNEYSNLFGFPLGYLSSTPYLLCKPINERPINVFFSGALHYTRLPLLQSFTKFRKTPFRLWNAFYHRFFKEKVAHCYDTYFPNSIIRFHQQGFRGGFAAPQFAQILYDCKIALCPNGVINAETYRHFESLRAGCIVVSNQLPNQYYYDGSPIVTLTDWNNLNELIYHLLSEPNELARLQQAGLDWWSNVCSEAAVARRIAYQLKTLSKDS